MVINYRDFDIEDWGGYYIILYPNKKPYKKIFYDINMAHVSIDELVKYEPVIGHQTRREKRGNLYSIGNIK
jgi:hypothetical protein